MRAAWICLFFALTACGEDLTEIVVVVTTDAAVPADLTSVKITVVGPSGDTDFDQTTMVTSRGQFPLTLSLTPADRLNNVSVRVTGTGPGGSIVREATTDFIEGRSLLLHMPLRSGCADNTNCDASRTCDASGATPQCVARLIDPATLPDWTGTPPGGADAGPPNPDSTVPDGGETCTTAPCFCSGPTDCATGELCTAGVCLDGPFGGLAIGVGHACGFFDSVVVCRGANSQGQLGNGTMSMSASFVQATGIDDAMRISAGAAYSCAIRAGGRVSCWGANESGQLGNGTTVASNVPMPVLTDATTELVGATRIATGDRHACAVATVGARDRVFCWGDNSLRQVARAASSPQLFAIEQVELTATPTRVAAGNGFTCAVATTNVFCWGQNAVGQCGRGTAGGTCDSPVIVNDIGGGRLSDVEDVVAGRAHACARLTSGGVFCWGDNMNGQLGDGTTMARPAAATAMLTARASQIYAGANHTCAFADSDLYCWGANGSGQLFLPTSGNHPMPEVAMAMPVMPDPSDHVWTGQLTTCVWETAGLRCEGSL
jgi:hypothetical protein